MSEQDFPLMTRKEAFDTDTKYFQCAKGCKDCGSKLRYWTTKSDSSIFCFGCHPDTSETCSKIKVASKKHNDKVKKMIKDNWTIPTVYGGYNTI